MQQLEKEEAARAKLMSDIFADRKRQIKERLELQKQEKAEGVQERKKFEAEIARDDSEKKRLDVERQVCTTQ